MTISKTANLVLIPSPGVSHLVPAMELAKHLVARDPRLAVTVLLIKPSVPDEKFESYILSLKSNSSLLNQGVGFIDIPQIDLNSAGQSFLTHIDAYQPGVKDAIEGLRSAGPAPVAGLLVDMFCTAMIDVATELGLSSYLFFTSCASLLRFTFHLQGLGVDVAREYDVVRSPGTVSEISGFQNPVPVKVWPGIFLADESSAFLRHTEKFRRTKGILVNTFTELERDFIHSLSQDGEIPPIYPVGPILDLPVEEDHDHNQSFEQDPIMRWLDDQAPRSVVFLCFGSRGSFNDTQIKEIAAGLERSGRCFLWSLRQRPNNQGAHGIPLELDDPNKVLPEGFLERTAEQGRVIGWAPQARVLAHKAVGAFVSHCGWNSTLESFWYGVPIAAWPIYAEQQLNAFLLVKELGLATEIRIDYRQDFGINMVVKAEEVEDGINKAMEETEVRKKVKEMCDKARKTLEEGGSSYASFGRFIEGVFENLH